MPLPIPKIPLKDHCSAIYNNTLYAFQPGAFQSLELKEGSQWIVLPSGVSTLGAACTRGTINNEDAFIVVGGSTDQEGYSGMQHYSFAKNAWTTDKPAAGIAINRRNHGIAFLAQSSQILMYGGSQDNANAASSQTFVISTQGSMTTQAFNSQAAPVSTPIMLSYNTTHALIAGGNPQSVDIHLFDPLNGWHTLLAKLPVHINDPSSTHAILNSKSDGSRQLEVFNFGVTPTNINTVILQNSTKSLHSRFLPHPHTALSQRDTTPSGSSSTNDSFAPSQVLTGTSLAYDPQTGLVLASGGSDQSPLAIFNQTSNSWIDANNFFGNEPAPTSSLTSTSSSPTSTMSAAPSVVAAAREGANTRSLKIVGGVIGGVLGAAVFVIIALILLRIQRKRRENEARNQESEYSMSPKRHLAFADKNAAFGKDDEDYSRLNSPASLASPHLRKGSDNSTLNYHDRSGTTTAQSKRALLDQGNGNIGSTRSFWNRNGPKISEARTPQISKPIIDLPLTKTLTPTRNDPESGWSRYFAGEDKANAQNIPIPQTVENPRPLTHISAATSSIYDNPSRVTSAYPHTSAEVAPLSVGPSIQPRPRSPTSNYPSIMPDPHSGLGVALSHDVNHGTEPAHSPPRSISDIEELTEGESELYRRSNGQESWTPSNDQRDSRWTDDNLRESHYTSSSHTISGLPAGASEHFSIPEFPMPSNRNSVATSHAPSMALLPETPTPALPSMPDSREPAGSLPTISSNVKKPENTHQQATGPAQTGLQRMNTSNSAVVDADDVRPAPKNVRGQRGSNPFYAGGNGIGHGSSGRRYDGYGPGHDGNDMSWLNLGVNSEPGRD